jgi:predicted phosphoribosyltransferase
VAVELDLPLDIFLVRKLGVPGQEEVAMGAIASGGIRVINEDVLRYLQISDETLASVAAQEQRELERREKLYRKGMPAADIKNKTVILIDDGLATGATMMAAALALKKLNARKIVVAVPVAAESTCREFRKEVDEIICGKTPEPFRAVGLWYTDFSQTTDDEVIELLRKSGETQKEHALQ